MENKNVALFIIYIIEIADCPSCNLSLRRRHFVKAKSLCQCFKTDGIPVHDQCA
jgi:hypothetical protein